MQREHILVFVVDPLDHPSLVQGGLAFRAPRSTRASARVRALWPLQHLGLDQFARFSLVKLDFGPSELVPKVGSCLQTVGNTISSTLVSRGVLYGPGHQQSLARQWFNGEFIT